MSGTHISNYIHDSTEPKRVMYIPRQTHGTLFHPGAAWLRSPVLETICHCKKTKHTVVNKFFSLTSLEGGNDGGWGKMLGVQVPVCMYALKLVSPDKILYGIEILIIITVHVCMHACVCVCVCKHG